MIRSPVTETNENWETTFVKPADHAPDAVSRQFGPLTAVSTGIPIPFFNPVFVFEPPNRDDVAEAVSWLESRDAPFQVTVADPVLDATRPTLADLGLEAADDQPGMALTSLDDIPDPGTALTIETVTDAEQLDEFVAVTAAAFGMPEEISRALAPESVLDDERMRGLLGRVDGAAVACGLLVRSDDVAGVYNVGVTEDYRRRGFGEAMTWALLRAGREAGCEMGALRSSEMGYPVYEGMGFETVVQYHHFQPV